MHQKQQRGFSGRLAVLVGLAALFAVSVPASAQMVTANQPLPDGQGYLVLQDFSDCSNSNVPKVDSPLVGGYVWVARTPDGTTSVKVAMTAKPSTTYHFFLKCVRLLGDIVTDSEGVANVSFSFPTSSTGGVFAFDMYPEGAPAGNKYQSSQISFP